MSCFLPDCSTVVPRTAKGRQRWYCCDEHRDDARTRRVGLERTILAIEVALRDTAKGTLGVDRRKLEADLRYLRVCLLAYSVPTDAPPAPR